MHVPVLCLVGLSLAILVQSDHSGRPVMPYVPYPKNGPSGVCSGEFMCTVIDHKMKPKCLCADQVCDGYPDCSDGSDEVGCTKPTVFHCSAGHLKCTGEDKCIHPSEFCNRRNDCNSGEDEQNCQFDRYICDGGEMTVPLNQTCDGIPQCPDEDDEANCGDSIQGECNCPDGWMVYSGSCYYFVDERLSFQDAQDHCTMMHADATLVEVNDAGETDFLESFLSRIETSRWWVGVSDEAGDGNWTFLSGDTPTYLNWGFEFPGQNPNATCAYIDYTRAYTMGNELCATEHKFVCEIAS